MPEGKSGGSDTVKSEIWTPPADIDPKSDIMCPDFGESISE